MSRLPQGPRGLGPLPTPRPARKRGATARVALFLRRYGWEVRVVLLLAALLGVSWWLLA